MHSSGSANNKPRQRTFTSCTECRRRKQRCNQAKDKPCNNCSRRYPPVLCQYESTSPPVMPDHAVDDQDASHSVYDQQVSPLSHPMGAQTHSQITNSGYTQPPNTPFNAAFIPTTSSDGYFPTYPSYSVPTSRPYYEGTNSDTSSAGSTGPSYVPTTTAGEDYLIEGGGPYYGGADHGFGGYYGDVGQTSSHGWVTGQSDVSSFAGANVNTSSGGDYFYVGDHHQVRTTRG